MAQKRLLAAAHVSEGAVNSHGRLTVHLKRAAGLKAADTGFMSSGKSDPYVLLRAGGEERKSQHINATLDPEFDETFTWEMDQDALLAKPLELHVFDDDLLNADDELGCIKQDLGWVKTHASRNFEGVPLDTQGTCDFSVTWEEEAIEGPSKHEMLSIDMSVLHQVGSGCNSGHGGNDGDSSAH